MVLNPYWHFFCRMQYIYFDVHFQIIHWESNLSIHRVSASHTAKSFRISRSGISWMRCNLWRCEIPLPPVNLFEWHQANDVEPLRGIYICQRVRTFQGRVALMIWSVRRACATRSSSLSIQEERVVTREKKRLGRVRYLSDGAIVTSDRRDN